jgi:hypothetical protein
MLSLFSSHNLHSLYGWRPNSEVDDAVADNFSANWKTANSQSRLFGQRKVVAFIGPR